MSPMSVRGKVADNALILATRLGMLVGDDRAQQTTQ